METLGPVNQLRTNTYSANTKTIRSKFKDYFSFIVTVELPI